MIILGLRTVFLPYRSLAYTLSFLFCAVMGSVSANVCVSESKYVSCGFFFFLALFLLYIWFVLFRFVFIYLFIYYFRCLFVV